LILIGLPSTCDILITLVLLAMLSKMNFVV